MRQRRGRTRRRRIGKVKKMKQTGMRMKKVKRKKRRLSKLKYDCPIPSNSMRKLIGAKAKLANAFTSLSINCLLVLIYHASLTLSMVGD
ncbi:hypothetical protein M1N59_01390 [Dehalococcoidales bacterium]|nr:hypothetical protein [Dehalococcoidales bacterium]